MSITRMWWSVRKRPSTEGNFVVVVKGYPSLMGGISLGTNISSLLAQRSTRNASEDIGRIFERLSTGMRINRASDDAAGLAIATSLNADSRVFARGMLNINDAVSALSVAEGSLNEASALATRLRELAVQAANGTFSISQRRALDKEADQLVGEFNRITQATAFNGRNLLAADFGSMRIQAGYGTNGSLDLQLNDKLSRNQGAGTYTNATTTGGQYQSVQLTDFNADGVLDMFSGTNTGFTLRLGKGDGTFGGAASIATGFTTYDRIAGDFNGDQKLDVVLSYGTDTYRTYFGNGDGTFKTGSALSGLAIGSNHSEVADINGDGKQDFVRASGTALETYLSNGDGSFKLSSTALVTNTIFSDTTLGDFDGNGTLDAVVTSGASGSVFLLNGDGSGGFGPSSKVADFSTFYWATSVDKGDFNGDGLLDFVATAAQDSSVRVMLNQGNGTFAQSARVAFGGTSISTVAAADLDADGITDLVFTDHYNQTSVSTSLGNGDGSFKASSTFATGVRSSSIAVGDINGDGVNDIMVGDNTGASSDVISLTSGTTRTTLLPLINLNTRADALAAISVIDSFQSRVSGELGALGSFQSRLSVAYNALSAQREQFLGAEARITNADVATESANLARKQILLQAGAAVLAAANQQPALALRLLQG